MSENVECPHCGQFVATEHDGETEYDQECSKCGEEFEVTVEFDPTYYSSIILYHNCLECGKKYRYQGYGSLLEKYKHLPRHEQYVCQDCNSKILAEEIKEWIQND
jgi:DNA-directed RNA polymerase subunit RPC12/RpoP